MLLWGREEFLFGVPSSVLLTSIPQAPSLTSNSLTLPLQFLPKGGGLVLPVLLEDSFRYFAIVDTGSPFLTGPDDIVDFTIPSTYPTTTEQYGQTIGEIQWRKANSLQLKDTIFNNVVIGVSTSSLVNETGGLFFGLMAQDDQRPTALAQLGYSSFSIDYKERKLLLDNARLDSEAALPIFDLSPYGPNLHHYAIAAKKVHLIFSEGETFTIGNSRREVVIVIDTGLTGCIFSDSWKEIFPTDYMSTMKGAKITLENGVVLESDSEHWFPSCFELPWFTSAANHPHIIAVGATFLSHLRINVDSQLSKIVLNRA